MRLGFVFVRLYYTIDDITADNRGTAKLGAKSAHNYKPGCAQPELCTNRAVLVESILPFRDTTDHASPNRYREILSEFNEPLGKFGQAHADPDYMADSTQVEPLLFSLPSIFHDYQRK